MGGLVRFGGGEKILGAVDARLVLVVTLVALTIVGAGSTRLILGAQDVVTRASS
nr:hypothetical protein [Nocardiopsis sp. CNR-923]